MVAAATLDRSSDLERLLTDVGGGGIAQMFRRMQIAEEEIAAAKLRWPRRKKAIHAAFGVLCAPRLSGYSDDVYRAHAREIIGRVMRREDVRLGTDAEVLSMFSETSLKAPLSGAFACAMSVVFHRVFPNADPERFSDRFTDRESWSNEARDIVDDARRRLACDRSV